MKILIFFFSSISYGQSLNMLFVSDGLAPNVSIPFEVTSGDNQVHVKDVLFDRNTGECKSLKDPFAPQIFHIRCSKEGGLQFRVIFMEDGVLKSSLSPAFDIKNLAGGVAVTPKPPADPKIAEGKTLFAVMCVKCHAPTDKRGRTALEIKNSLSIPQMANDPNIKGRTFSDSDLNALSAYLRSL